MKLVLDILRSIRNHRAEFRGGQGGGRGDRKGEIGIPLPDDQNV